MRLGIMQPYLFPYLGYFQLIRNVDKWVVFDDVQYISKGWVNRNRILHPGNEKDWQYITVPISKHSRTSAIKDIEINNNIEWRNKMMGQLTSYKKKSPHYKFVSEFVLDVISYSSSNLSDFIVNALAEVCKLLNIDFDYEVFSHMDIEICDIEHPGQWAVEISSALGATEYVNPAGGYQIFNENEFFDKNITLEFLKPKLSSYVQRQGFFTPGLSIIDVLMWNDLNGVKDFLEDYEIVSKASLTGV